MQLEKVNFYGPGLPWIIVQKLTKEIIYEAVEGYLNASPNGFWLKLYHFAIDINITVFNQLQVQQIRESAQLNLFTDLNNLKEKINKLDSVNKSDLVTSLHKLLSSTNIQKFQIKNGIEIYHLYQPAS